MTGRASFSRKGLKGEVVFKQFEQYVEIVVNITGVGKDVINWEIRSLPSTGENCDEDYLGNV